MAWMSEIIMINLDGSHESWLIYSDWLEDQDDSKCYQIRSDLEDDIDNWTFESCYYYGGVGYMVGGGDFGVGDFNYIISAGYVVGGGVDGGDGGDVGGVRRISFVGDGFVGDHND
jgi:hypothetical protein